MKISVANRSKKTETLHGAIVQALRRSAKQFGSAIPVIAGVVMLMGLLRAFLEKDFIAALVSEEGLGSIVSGAAAGSLFSGNPVTSYIIGGEFLDQGVGLVTVTAFMLAWVSVGLIQLPAEIDALGRRFALLRNGLSFVSSIGIATLTVAACRLLWG